MALFVGMTKFAMAQTTIMQQNDEYEFKEEQVVDNKMERINSCTLTIYYSDGTVASTIKVSITVSGGSECIGGSDFFTDNKGVVTLYWGKNCYLKKVYVKGQGYNVDYYRNGNSYSLTLN